MNEDSLRELVVAFGAGLGLLLVAGLRWLPKDWPRSTRLSAVLLTFVGTLLAPIVVGQPDAALIPLGIVGVAFALVLTHRRLVQTIAQVGAGIALFAGAVARIELPADKLARAEVATTGPLVMGSPAPAQAFEQPTLREAIGARATTDRGREIRLAVAANNRPDSNLVEPEHATLIDLGFAERVLHIAPASDDCNCFGWVFAAGRYYLSPQDVELILEENGYRSVSDPRPGDLVIFRNAGPIEHIALVCAFGDGQPTLVLSKWGWLGVYVHKIDESVYGDKYAFFRSARDGHLLEGLGHNKSAPTKVRTPITE